MVTDIHTNYTSPAGKEFTLTAGRFAGIHPASRILDAGCGYGEGVCNICEEFRCKATAVDINPENIEFARELAIKKKVSHLIEFKVADLQDCDFSEEPFELILAEGGILSFLGRREGLTVFKKWLQPRGWVEFSDLILLSKNIPSQILNIFEHNKYQYETEDSYRRLLAEQGFDVKFIALVPPSGWDNYYAHMSKRLEDDKGFFANKQIKLAFHKEIDIFYRMEAYKYIGYMVCIARLR